MNTVKLLPWSPNHRNKTKNISPLSYLAPLVNLITYQLLGGSTNTNIKPNHVDSLAGIDARSYFHPDYFGSINLPVEEQMK